MLGGIACRQIGGIRLPIWGMMLAGAGAVLICGSITPTEALHAVNIEIIIFLFSVFLIGSAMEESGYLGYLARIIFSRAETPGQLISLFILTMGGFSALLMNDTLAIVGTPIALALARTCEIPDRIFLLALAGAITTGSIISPIGNPQNLLIAIGSGMENPFLTFIAVLFIPTALSGLILYGIIRRMTPSLPAVLPPVLPEAGIRDQKLARLCRLSLGIFIGLIILRIICIATGHPPMFTLQTIAAIAAAPILLSPHRFAIMRSVDYRTLLFFVGLFILMEAVWIGGTFPGLIPQNLIHSIPWLIGGGILISQIISNVPFVALIIPSLMEAGSSEIIFLALAAGSTIGGNLTILGAASNVIIIQNAERRGATITFIEFLRFGIPVTILQAAVFIGWFALIA
ncbi:SLC13 family permease [Methanocalculus alkaliphilus]|uniref:SLC13 family permease n=1 Tax=Methanocalculus alkaliphilus TaxID=768730 RepID=UPI00344E1ABB